jgi:hypothetical protein
LLGRGAEEDRRTQGGADAAELAVRYQKRSPATITKTDRLEMVCMGKWLVVVVAVAVAVWWFTRDPVEVAYQKCLKQVSGEMDKSVSSGSSDIEKAMADAVKGVGKAVGTAGCEAMRSACKDNRDGALCKAALAQF